MGGGVLDVHERLVDLEGLGEVLCAVGTEVVVVEAANAGANAASAAADDVGGV